MEDKKKRIKQLAAIIITILVIIGVLFFYNDSTHLYLPSSINDEVKSVEIKNDIQSNITEVKYNVPLSEIAKDATLYKVKNNTANIIDEASKKLDMTTPEDNGTVDLTSFKDDKGNSIMYQKSSNIVYIQNTNNPNLTNFNRDNILDKLSKLFDVDMSSYYLSSQAESLDKLSDIFDFSYKIKSFKLVTDFNYQGLLKVYLSKDGNLKTITWNYMNFDEIGNVKLLSLSYVKDNFNYITKGVYPNFTIAPISSANSQGDQLPIDIYTEKVDFKGRIEVNNIELSYLLSEDNTKVIIPIYRLSTKFFFDTGKVTDGTIIIPAADINAK